LSNILIVLPLALAVIALLIFLFMRLLKNKNSTDIILLGIEITLTGGILLISNSSAVIDCSWINPGFRRLKLFSYGGCLNKIKLGNGAYMRTNNYVCFPGRDTESLRYSG
jgi:hypothetical protein